MTVNQKLMDVEAGSHPLIETVGYVEGCQGPEDEGGGEEIPRHPVGVHPQLQWPAPTSLPLDLHTLAATEPHSQQKLADAEHGLKEHALEDDSRNEGLFPRVPVQEVERPDALDEVQGHHHNRNDGQRRPAGTPAAPGAPGLRLRCAKGVLAAGAAGGLLIRGLQTAQPSRTVAPCGLSHGGAEPLEYGDEQCEEHGGEDWRFHHKHLPHGGVAAVGKILVVHCREEPHLPVHVGEHSHCTHEGDDEAAVRQRTREEAVGDGFQVLRLVPEDPLPAALLEEEGNPGPQVLPEEPPEELVGVEEEGRVQPGDEREDCGNPCEDQPVAVTTAIGHPAQAHDQDYAKEEDHAVVVGVHGVV
mmetsp:Transcript_88787/g.264905  ORF Transcript_88787/g.264905 Transcript_88787/m.264905 type:complete len:358 (+) Transcript_88787:271-1344(+)